jgi:hypothetical protein
MSPPAPLGRVEARRHAAGPVGHDLELRLGHYLVVADARLVDGVGGQRLVLAHARRQVGEGLLGRPQGELGDVVHGVAEVGELPVDDGDDPTPGVHEVARPGDTLHKHHQPLLSGTLRRSQSSDSRRRERHRTQRGHPGQSRSGRAVLGVLDRDPSDRS